MMEPPDIKCPSSGRRCTKQCWDGECKNILSPEEARRIPVPDPWGVTPRKDYVYTIMWRYSDNSASGVLNVAFRKKEDAEDMLNLLDEHSESKHFTLCQSVLKY